MITEPQYLNAAQIIGCDVPAIKSVAQVEGGGIGFYHDGRIILKYEGHVFHKFTKGKFDQAHPTLSYPSWTEKFSAYGPDAYHRFNQAFSLDPHAAMMSTSWGMFQIMGENYSSCGFKSVDAFISFLKIDEGHHLIAFADYLVDQVLAKYLRTLDWANFAKHYNGPLWQKNNYAGKLAAAYVHFKP